MGRPRKNAAVVKRPDQDVLMRRIFEEVGRDEFVAALSSDADPRAHQFVELLLDPEYTHLTEPQIAQKVGLTRHELTDLHRRYSLDKGKVLVSKQLPYIMEDTAIDARSVDILCWECEGTGRVKKKVCPVCKGLLKVRKIGDEASRKIVHEEAGLIGRRGPLLAQQFVSLNSDQFEPLEKVVGSARKALEGVVVEATSEATPSEDSPSG